MAETFTSYSVDNDRRFRNALKAAAKAVKDLTIPLTLITRDFFRSQKSIWMLSGPGQYPDLAPRTKKWKLAHGKAVYPILKNTGKLERSMTDPGDSNAIATIVNKSVLLLGTKVEYGVYHQSDRARSKIPLRKFLFIGPESTFANNDQMGRTKRWLGILEGHVQAQSRRFAKVGPSGG